MTPPGSQQVPARYYGRLAAAIHHLVLGLRVRAFHWRLDTGVAAGIDPASERALCARAGQLVSRKHRDRLAAWLERLVHDSKAASVRSFSAALPIASEQVAEARGSLLFLAYVLRHAEHVTPRGVALVERMLRDGDSALYVPSAHDAVELQVQTVLDCLVGELRASPEAWFSVSDTRREALVGGD